MHHGSLEGVVAVTTVVTAFITVPATLVAGHWTRRSMDRAADAAVAVGLGRSEAAVPWLVAGGCLW
jgi:hypothetical protein